MKKIFLTILFVFVSKMSFGQQYEAGIVLGGSNLIGDVGRDYFILPNSFAGGVMFKYNFNSRVALRANLTYFNLQINDNQSDNYFRKERGKSFSNDILEFAIGTEFNFLRYTLDYPISPYILTQIAVFQYNVPVSYKKGIIEKGTDISYTLPVGLGVKARLSDDFAVSLEGGIRFTLKDDLDYTTDKIKELDFGRRGFDHYMFVGASLVYTFGRPDCYAERD